MSTVYPTQSAYLPTGVNGTTGTSTYIVGRTISGSYEGVGLGAGGRPDYVEVIQFNLAQRSGNGTLIQRGTITMNVTDLVTAASLNTGFPSNLNLTLRQVSVCESGVTKGMIILGSQTFVTGAA
jgi:hypothetical protein